MKRKNQKIKLRSIQIWAVLASFNNKISNLLKVKFKTVEFNQNLIFKIYKRIKSISRIINNKIFQFKTSQFSKTNKLIVNLTFSKTHLRIYLNNKFHLSKQMMILENLMNLLKLLLYNKLRLFSKHKQIIMNFKILKLQNNSLI